MQYVYWFIMRGFQARTLSGGRELLCKAFDCTLHFDPQLLVFSFQSRGLLFNLQPHSPCGSIQHKQNRMSYDDVENIS